MTKPLLAFFLACLSTSLLLSSLTLIHPLPTHQRPVQVVIRADNDVHDIVTAVESLHRQDVDVQTMKSFSVNRPSFFVTAGGASLGFMLMTAVILSFYKQYCRWLGCPPTI
jgi:VanZ family protein